MAFEWDDLAMLQGLQQRSELNGRAVRVMATTPKDPSERVHVELMTNAGTRLRVKAVNMRPLRAPDDLEAVDVKAAMPEADIVDCGMFFQVAQHSHKVPGCPGLSLVSIGESADEERHNVAAAMEQLKDAGIGPVTPGAPGAPVSRAPSPTGRRPGDAFRLNMYKAVNSNGGTSTAFRSERPLRESSEAFQANSGVCYDEERGFHMCQGYPLTPEEKVEALRVGRFGEKTTPMEWADFTRSVKAARGGAYSSDWRPEILERALYKRSAAAQEAKLRAMPVAELADEVRAAAERADAEMEEQLFRSMSTAALANAVTIENDADVKAYIDAACAARREA